MATAEFVDERMTAAADDPMSAATDLAEHLVRAGDAVPRGARGRRRGSCASRSSAACRSTSSCRTIRGSGPTASALLEPGSAVRRRTTPGGAGPEPVARQLDAARERLAEQQVWLER